MLDKKTPNKDHKPALYKQLYFQVLMAILFGVIIGALDPNLGVKMKPLGDGFINLVTMIIGPIIFCTVVSGIGKAGDLKDVGRIGVKSLFYFEVVSTIALIVGLIVVNIMKPGIGINMENLDPNAILELSAKTSGQSLNAVSFLFNIIPQNVVQSFAENNILQILFFAVLFGLALSKAGDKTKSLVKFLDQSSIALFGIIDLIMKASPIGAFGAMAYTVGKHGTTMLITLSKFMGCVYFACLLFVTLILGSIAKIFNFSLIGLLKHLKDEIFVVLGTSSSESVLPQLMHKMETFGCDRSVVGMVIPTGYSFNLDGTSIYLTMAAIFLAQATGVDLTLGQQLTIVGILFITSKGAAGVSGAGFIVLVSTLAILDVVPSSSAAILIGIDRFMSQARAVTNLIGNGVAAVVVAKWENAFKTNSTTSSSLISEFINKKQLSIQQNQ